MALDLVRSHGVPALIFLFACRRPLNPWAARCDDGASLSGHEGDSAMCCGVAASRIKSARAREIRARAQGR